jgi:hypothetical protein
MVKSRQWLGMVAHISNPRYSGGEGQLVQKGKTSSQPISWCLDAHLSSQLHENQKHETLSKKKITKAKRAGGVVQVEEHSTSL